MNKNGKALEDSPPQGETVPVLSDGRAPRLPHERDESSSSQESGPRAVIEQAADDLKQGLLDTDRGPQMDALYQRAFRSPKKVQHRRKPRGSGR